MEDYEKKYKDALAKAREIHRNEDEKRRDMEWLFPELKESKDEKIRKALIERIIEIDNKEYINNGSGFYAGDYDADEICDWLEEQGDKDKLIKELGEYKVKYTQEVLSQQLEKQGEIDKVSYKIAEKEKYDFVSEQFIECRKSFDVFKEDNSYWLEYVGNDNYIGRSDNILNQKFHITPRQLYCLFTQEHCPKEDNANAPIEYGKYVDECLNEASKHFFSEGEDKYSVADLFYAGVRCGRYWFGKQGDRKPTSDTKYEVKGGNSLSVNAFDYKYATITQKDFASKEEPKFKVGDIIVNDYCMGRVVEITNDAYLLDTEQGIPFSCEHNAHLWTIQDAKDGDVLISQFGNPLIYNGNYNSLHIGAYCGMTCDDNKFKVAEEKCHWTENVDIKPSTKEQCDKLFKAMKEAGYEFDFDKKELKKTTQKDFVPKEDICKEAKSKLTPFDKKVRDFLFSFYHEVCNGMSLNEMIDGANQLNAMIGNVEQKPTEWSEEDDKMYRMCVDAVEYYHTPEDESVIREWLKSLKNRLL